MLDNSKPPFRLLRTEQMPFSKWLPIEDCPFQRDTEGRAKGATHLEDFKEVHRKVAIAILPTGKRYKLDGHTRALYWSSGLARNVPSPLVLSVDVYECAGRDRESLGALYDTFDSRRTVKTAADVTHGAGRELQLNLQSPMLRKNHFSGAMKRLYQITRGYADGDWSDEKFTYIVLEYFKRELQLFDTTQPKKVDYLSPIMMAAILTIMRYGEAALPFWCKYADNAGEKTAEGCDGVMAMRNLLAQIRKRKAHGSQHDLDNVGRALNAFDRYRDSEGKSNRARYMYAGKSGVPNPKDKPELERFIEAARTAKETAR